jgi:hypothetical protein
LGGYCTHAPQADHVKTIKPILPGKLKGMEEAKFGKLVNPDSSPHFVATKKGEFDKMLDQSVFRQEHQEHDLSTVDIE